MLINGGLEINIYWLIDWLVNSLLSYYYNSCAKVQYIFYERIKTKLFVVENEGVLIVNDSYWWAGHVLFCVFAKYFRRVIFLFAISPTSFFIWDFSSEAPQQISCSGVVIRIFLFCTGLD